MQDNKEKLQQQLASIIKQYRLNTNKSISLLSNEIDMSKSILSDLEKGIKDPQFSTLWRIAEGLNINLSEVIKLLENKLPKDFSLIDK